MKHGFNFSYNKLDYTWMKQCFSGIQTSQKKRNIKQCFNKFQTSLNFNLFINKISIFFRLV